MLDSVFEGLSRTEHFALEFLLPGLVCFLAGWAVLLSRFGKYDRGSTRMMNISGLTGVIAGGLLTAFGVLYLLWELR